MDTLTQTQTTQAVDFLPLNGTDHIEFYVGNAKQSAYYYQAAFGYKLVAYAGPETGLHCWPTVSRRSDSSGWLTFPPAAIRLEREPPIELRDGDGSCWRRGPDQARGRRPAGLRV
jgi:catechol 2,3-dioxygenase-like lactoylglutathione lyase family enzyme